MRDSGGFQGFEEDHEPPPNGPGFSNRGGHGRGADKRTSKATHQPKQLSTIWADDIELQLDTAGLVDGLLSSTGMTVLYGESGSGKTFVAIDLGCHVAAGKCWRELAVEQGVVVYIAAEAPESVKRRLWAWKRHHKVEHLPVIVVQSTVDLLNGDTEALAELLEKLKVEHGRIALVVVDTLARAMTGNENAPDDMGKFVAACGRLREAGDTHVLVVHHSGKDLARGARGHSSLRAATDVELEVTNGETGGAIRVTKHRDEAGGASYAFRLEPVELGTNSKSRTVTTCIVAESEAEVTSVTRVTSLRPNMRVTYEALQAAVTDHGAEPPLAPDIPRNVKVVTVEQWRDAAARYLPQAEAKLKNQAFNRSMEALVAQKLVRHVNGVVWIQAGKMVVASGHAGHAGHVDPHVTDVTDTQAPGHVGHAGHTHPLGCDLRDRDREGQEQPAEDVEDGLSKPAEGGVFNVETFLASMSAEDREWLDEIASIPETAISAAVDRANAENRLVTRDDFRKEARSVLAQSPERAEVMAPPHPVAQRNVIAVFDRKHAQPMTLAVLNPDGTPQVWESRVFRLATGQTEAGVEVDARLHAGGGRRTERRFGPGVSVLVVEGHGRIPCPLAVGTPLAEVVNRLRSSGAKVFIDTFGEMSA
jgi:hypothetical protein